MVSVTGHIGLQTCVQDWTCIRIPTDPIVKEGCLSLKHITINHYLRIIEGLLTLKNRNSKKYKIINLKKFKTKTLKS